MNRLQLKLHQVRTRRTERPPKVATNIEWIRKGVGWDCREVYYIGKQRHRRHLKHLGRAEWETWQSEHSGAALEAHVAKWVREQMEKKDVTQ
jgi:hypothetical protein